SGDGELSAPRGGPGLRQRGEHRPPPAHAAGVRVHLARADRHARGAGRRHAHDQARHDGARPAPPQPRVLRQGVGDARPPVGQPVPNIDPVLRRIAKYADTWVPHSSSTPEQVTGDWVKVQRFAREAGRDPAKISRVYSNFVWVLEPGEKPETAAKHFSVYSGMDLDYWKTYYLLG